MNAYNVRYTIIILYCSVEAFKDRADVGSWKFDSNSKIRKLSFTSIEYF